MRVSAAETSGQILTSTYWRIGLRIVAEKNSGGVTRRKYGKGLVARLAHGSARAVAPPCQPGRWHGSTSLLSHSGFGGNSPGEVKERCSSVLILLAASRQKPRSANPSIALENPNRSRHVEADRIVHRVGQGLFGAEIPLRGLDRGVTEQQLDLLQLPAGLST